VKLKSNSEAENLKREAVKRKKKERGTQVREDPILADRAGRRTEVQNTAEQKVTWSKKRIRVSGGDIQNQNDGYQSNGKEDNLEKN
jgi:hypothetical protein